MSDTETRKPDDPPRRDVGTEPMSVADMPTLFRIIAGMKIDPLEGQPDYQDWKTLMSDVFDIGGLSDIVFGREALPASPPAAVKTWKIKNQSAMTVIRMHLTAGTRIHIRNAGSAYDAWRTLENVFARKGHFPLLLTLNKLLAVRYVDGEPMAVHIGSVEALLNDLADNGLAVPLSLRVLLLLNSLPRASWETFWQQHTGPACTIFDPMTGRKELDRDLIVSALLDEAEGRSQSSAPVAAAVGYPDRGGGGRRPGGGRCFYCSKPGCRVESCPAAREDGSAGKLKAGFRIAARGDGWVVKYRRELFAPSPEAAPAHAVEGDDSESDAGESVMPGAYYNRILCVRLNSQTPVLIGAVKGERSTWIADTGAALSLTPHRDLLRNFVPETKWVEAANGTKGKLLGRGDAVIQGCLVKDVWHWPDVTCNLLSIHAIAERNPDVRFSFGPHDAELRIGGEVAMTAKVRHGQYVVCEDASIGAPMALAVKAAVPLALWHRRLGHFHEDGILSMARKGLVRDLALSDEKRNGDCEPCSVGKAKHYPVPKVAYNRATEPLGRIHLDLTGPHPAAHDGSLYGLEIVDNFSRLTSVRGLKSKGGDVVMETVKAWMARAKRALGKKLKVIRLDGAREFIHGALKAWCEANGISLEVSAPHEHHQNGVVEHSHLTHFDMVRSMLAEGGLKERWWLAALEYSAYVRACLPHSAVPNRTPHEAFYGTKPSLAARATRGKFIGITPNYAAFRILLDDGRVVTSTQVNFVEDAPEKTPLALDDFEPVTKGPPDEPPQNASAGEEVPAERSPSPNLEEIPSPTPPPEPRFDGVDPANIIEGPRLRRPTQKAVESGLLGKNVPGALAVATLSDEPSSLADVLRRPDREQWLDAMAKEVSALCERNVYKHAKRPPGEKLIPCLWAFKLKLDKEGKPERYKARCVANGARMGPNDYSIDKSSPVVALKSLRFFLALAASLDWDTFQFDIIGTYLNAKLTKPVYALPPPGYEELLERLGIELSDKERIWVLLAALYGLPHSGAEWHNEANDKLLEAGFEKSTADSCIFLLRGDGGAIVFAICLYVDDVACGQPRGSGLFERVLEKLRKSWDLTAGDLTFFLSMRVHRDRTSKMLYLTMTPYIDSLIARSGFGDQRSAPTPMDGGTQLLSTKPGDEMADTALYQSLVGGLQWLASTTRPDIAYVASALAAHSSSPNSMHMGAMRHVIRYLKETRTYGLGLGGAVTPRPEIFSDSDFANDTNPPTPHRSCGAYVSIYGGSIGWATSKQSTITGCTMEAEYLALSTASKQAMFWQKVVADFCLPPGPITLHEDNQAAISTAKSQTYTGKTKHFDIGHHFVRECLKFKVVTVQYVESAKNVADILTKPLGIGPYTKLRTMLGVVDCARLL